MIIEAIDKTPIDLISRWSKKKVVCGCDNQGCSNRWETNFFHAHSRNKHECRSCKMSKPRSPQTRAHKEAISRGVKSSITDELRRKYSETAKMSHQRGAIRSPYSKGEMSKADRARISERMTGNDYSSGESGGRCKWYTITNNGKEDRVQGTWEKLFAEWMISRGIEFVSHPSCVHYTDDSGVQRRYFPDFYLPETEEYIDVKNPYLIAVSKRKIELVRATGVNLKIISKQDLDKLDM